MSFFVEAKELRKALKEIAVAEKNGFKFCLAVFEPNKLDGIFIGLQYSDIWEKAHPTDGNFNWGRCQGVTKDNLFHKGRLIPKKKRVEVP